MRDLPGVYFIIGGDTLTRVLDPKYGPVEDTLESMRRAGNKFLVFSRPGREIPPLGDYGDLFKVLSWGDVDLSSTQIRNSGPQAAACLLAFHRESPGKWWAIRTGEDQREWRASGLAIPGGSLNPGESPVEGAIREFEEMGLKVRGRPRLVFTSTCAGLTTYTFMAEAEGEPQGTEEGTAELASASKILEEAVECFHGYNTWALRLAEILISEA